ncbi:hypothetical protein NP233_g7829 [Leucocoprinus birnbaumii]|uniref:Uncharacterized protein n=1 Tax=Leucocoprinus birnbaumii TaxID=56174 RepID=A0AAD5VNJ8_9AGAR|nr:hypothetical protein NP233_g7829 [Leucocoprinus birnbaumii]
MSSPPAYDDVMQRLEELRKRGLTSEEKSKAYNAMSSKIISSQEEIAKGVRELADQAVKTDRTFETIQRGLATVDQNNYKDKNGKPIPKLQPTWVKYQKRYINLLWRSRYAATMTEAYLRGKYTVLLTVVLAGILENNSTHDDNVRDLTAFSRRHNPVKAKDQDDDFTKLKTDVVAFTEKFSEFAKDEGTRLSDAIKGLNEDIDNLKKELAELNKVVTQMSIAIGATVVAGAAGIIAGVTVLSASVVGEAVIIPVLLAAVAALITETAKLIVALKRKTEVDVEIAAKQAEINKLTAEQKTLADLQAKLELCADQGSEMFGRLANFSEIWSMCAQDAQGLIKSIGSIHTDKALQARIKLMSVAYKSVADALAVYATCIDTSDISPSDPAPAYES